MSQPLPQPLLDAKETVPGEVREVVERLRERGFKAFLVGGCVRDVLRGAHPKDFDVATSARPEQVQRAFSKVIPTGIEHGTVTVLKGTRHIEVTTFRKESRLRRRPPPLAGRVPGRDRRGPLAPRLHDQRDGLGPGRPRVLRPVRRPARSRGAHDPLRRQRARPVLRGRAAGPARGALRRDARLSARPAHRGGDPADARRLPQGRDGAGQGRAPEAAHLRPAEARALAAPLDRAARRDPPRAARGQSRARLRGRRRGPPRCSSCGSRRCSTRSKRRG